MLRQIIDKMRLWWVMRDDAVIKTILATALTRKSNVVQLFLILVANSSSAKTDFINLLDNDRTTIKLDKITPSSLGSGRKTNGLGLIDRIAKQKEGVILLIPEMATILNMSQDTQNLVFSRFRSLTDGEIKVDSDNESKTYSGLNVTLIAGSTPDIYSKAIAKELMGTRELYLRLEEENEEQLLEKTYNNSNKNKLEFMKELKGMIKKLLEEREFKGDLEISKEIRDKIYHWTRLTILLRAPANKNTYTGELVDKIYPERLPRLFLQLISMFRALKSLDDSVTDEEALDVIKKLCLSNCEQRRIDSLIYLLKENAINSEGKSSRETGNSLRISKNTALGELNVLHHLELANKISTGVEPYISEKFKANEESEDIQFLAKELGISLKIETIKVGK